MRFPDAAYLQRVESMTDEIERGSAAEVVVTVASRAGSYRDVDQTWAALFALATLLVLVFSPIYVREEAIVPNLLISYGLGWFCSRRSPAMRRLLTSAGRREAQVRDAARCAFLAEALDAVPGRVGVLVYLSLLERRIEIVADHGLQGTLGLAPIHAFGHALAHVSERDFLTAFMTAFEAFGKALQGGLPCTADTVHAIPNRPRVVNE